MPDIVIETDLSANITFVSENALDITGFTPEDMGKGMNILQFVVPEDRERAKENIRRHITGERTVSDEYRIFRKNGVTFPSIVKTTPIYSEGRMIGLRGLVIDITEQKKTEADLTFYLVFVE